MRLTLLTFSSLIALLMAVVQHYALANNWYWEYWWLDLAMHFSGGVLITTIASACIGIRAVAILYMCIVALLWEVYEYAIGATFVRENLHIDTALDLAFGLIGGVGAYGIMHLWQKYAFPSTVARDVSPDQTSLLR